MICEAIIHKPKRIATPLGTLGQILYAINPKSIDYILNSAYHLFPDSSAAQGREEAARARGRSPTAPAAAARDERGVTGSRSSSPPDARHPLVARRTGGPQDESTGAGGSRTGSPIGRRARGGGGRRSASGSASAARRSRSRCRSRRSSCRRRGVAPPASLARALHRRPPRARLPRPRQGLPRRGARLPRRRSTTRPTWSPVRATRPRSRRCSRWCADGGRGRDPLRRRHQRRRRGRAAGRATATRGAVTIDLGALDRVLEVDPVSRRGADPGRRARPVARGPARASTGSPCATSRSRSSSRRSAAGSPPGPAATSRPSTPTSTTWSSRSGRSPRRGVWESRRLPGSGAGPSPDRMLLGSEGILGVITEAWVRVQERPRLQGSRRGRVRVLRRAAPRRCASSRSPGSTRPTAACSTRPRRQLTARGRRPAGRCWSSASSRPTTRSTRRCDLALELRPRPRRRAGRGPQRASAAATTTVAAAERLGRRLAARLPRRAVPARHVRRRRRARRHLRDRDHLGPLRRLPRAR